MDTKLTCQRTRQIIYLIKEIANSGEGKVWQTDKKGYLAKIYHHHNPERIKKLQVMINNPPEDPNRGLNHISFAWPYSILKNKHGIEVGFLMPRIERSVELLNIYTPRLRQQKKLINVDWRFLHYTALNLALTVYHIHDKGYVIGDMKPQNILVNDRALPSIIDIDSFQVADPKTQKIYRCLVGSDGFTPTELIGQDLALVNQTEIHDRFRLAVIIYLLLFADHPFKGKWIGEGDSPEPIELVKQGFWPYADHSKIKSGPLTIPLKIVHPKLQQCFLSAFNLGHTRADNRPNARQWYEALKVAISELQQCELVYSHYRSGANSKCYWCDRHKQLGVDIFSDTLFKKIPPPSPNDTTTTSTSNKKKITPTPPNESKVPLILTGPSNNTLPNPTKRTILHAILDNIFDTIKFRFDNPTGWSISLIISIGGLLYLTRKSLADISSEFQLWVLSYPPSIKYTNTWIAPHQIFKVIPETQLICAAFGLIIILLLLLVIKIRRW